MNILFLGVTSHKTAYLRPSYLVAGCSVLTQRVLINDTITANLGNYAHVVTLVRNVFFFLKDLKEQVWVKAM